MLKTRKGQIIGNIPGEGVPLHVSPERLIKLEEVLDLTGLEQAAVYKRMLEGTFPRPVRISKKCSRWVESEVQAWIDARIADRDEGRQSEPHQHRPKQQSQQKPKRAAAERVEA